MENQKTVLSKAQKEKIGKYFFWVAFIIEVVLLVFLCGVVYQFFKHLINIYSALAIGLIILWVGVLIAYYAWAVYFYNINFGLTDKDWEKIDDARNTCCPLSEPDKNPNSEETFGLPPGTVRGSIAITLMIGALSVTLLAFGRDNIVKENEIFVDSFDFFKTAFLMMIAFYFGQKSLEYLLPKKKQDTGQTDSGQTDTVQASGSTSGTESTTQTTTFAQDGAQG